MNLSVTGPGDFLYTNDGHWLHPLFDLENHLKEKGIDPSLLYLKDKLIGRGAAVLIHRMGIKKCHGKTVSRRGLDFFRNKGIECTYDTLVDRLACQTELVLTDDLNDEEAYLELTRRAGRGE